MTAGVLTQYYFVVFAFFISISFCCYQFIRKKWKELIVYGGSVLLGMGTGILLFPASLHQILLGDKGKDSMRNLRNGLYQWVQRCRSFEGIMEKELLGWQGGMFLWIVFAATVIFFCVRYKKCSAVVVKEKEEQIVGWGIVIFTICGYFFLISEIATDLADRYQFLIYPLLCLVFSLPVIVLSRLLQKPAILVICAAIYLGIISTDYKEGAVPYLYPGYEEALGKLREEYQEAPGIYITKGDYLVINNCLFLGNQKKTYPILESELEGIQPIMQGRMPEQLVVYVDIYFDELGTAEKLAGLLNYNRVELLYDNTYTQIYVLGN